MVLLRRPPTAHLTGRRGRWFQERCGAAAAKRGLPPLIPDITIFVTRLRFLLPVLPLLPLLPVLAVFFPVSLAAQTPQLPGNCPVSTHSLPADAEKRVVRTAIRDSLRTEMIAAARDAGVAEPAGLVAIRMADRRDRAGEATVFEGNVPNAVVDAVVSQRGALLARWPDREPWLHGRLDGPRPPEESAVECLPAPRNVGTFQREIGRIFQSYRPQPGSPRRVQMAMRLLVSRDGEVVFGVMARRGPGAALDRAVLDAGRDLRFRPATAGGVPVDVWVELPIEFSRRGAAS